MSYIFSLVFDVITLTDTWQTKVNFGTLGLSNPHFLSVLIVLCFSNLLPSSGFPDLYLCYQYVLLPKANPSSILSTLIPHQVYSPLPCPFRHTATTFPLPSVGGIEHCTRDNARSSFKAKTSGSHSDLDSTTYYVFWANP